MLIDETEPTWGHVIMPFAALVPAAAVIAGSTGRPAYAFLLIGCGVGAVAALEAVRQVRDQ